MKLYVNGAEAEIGDYSTAISVNTNDFIVGRLFSGNIDEVAIYNCVLTPGEVLDRYKRGSLRLVFQVRSGDTDPPAGNFIGPDGTNLTYYTDLDISGQWPAFVLANVSDGRYFQFKAYFETDDALYSPELKSIGIEFE